MLLGEVLKSLASNCHRMFLGLALSAVGLHTWEHLLAQKPTPPHQSQWSMSVAPSSLSHRASFVALGKLQRYQWLFWSDCHAPPINRRPA